MEFFVFVNAFLEIQLIGLSTLFLFRKVGNRSANLWLGSYILIISLVLLPGILTYMGQLNHLRLFVNFDHFLGFALPPTLYLYAEALMKGKVSHVRWRVLHYLPAIASTIYFMSFHFLTESEKLVYLSQLNESVNSGPGQVVIYIYFFHFLTYFGLVMRSIVQYKKSHKSTLLLKHKINLNWLTVFAFHQLLTSAFITFLTLTGNTPERNSFMVFFATFSYYYFIFLLFKYPKEIHAKFRNENQVNGQRKLFLSRELFNQSIPGQLSEREFEVLCCLVDNLSYAEIADKIDVSINTVKFHLKRIYEKLGVNNRMEVLQFAYQVSHTKQE